MAFYEVDFSYKVSEWGTITLEANNPDEADDFGREHVYQAFPDATDITIDAVKEVKVG